MRTRSEINSTEWFGHIPNGWEMRPIKALFRFSKGLSITKADLSECGAPVISYGQIHSKDYDGTGITESLIRYVPKSIAQSSNSSYVKHGGFIFADTSEDLAGVGNCAYNDGNEDLFGGYRTIVANPLLSSENKYFAYLFRTDAWRKQLRKQLVDVKLFSVNQSILGESYVAVPPLDVQRSIVAFLDSRCKPINEAIARHRMIIDKLEDYRKAVITKAVTKGLDESAPMKDSGIEWIGSMPANWSTTKLKFLCMSHNGVDYNSQDLCNQNDDNSLFVIRSSNLVNGAVVHGDDVYINKPVPKNMLLRKGDLVIVRTNGSRRLVGKCALVTKNEKATAGAFMLICRSSLNPYIYWVLNSSLLSFHRGHFDTTTINQMSNEMLKNMIIPLPPHEQMIDIMTYLDYKCAAINEGVNRQEQVIARLEEYRRSLIFHAVTGRIDCTGGAC